MKANGRAAERARARAGSLWAVAGLVALLQGCGVYREWLQRGGSLRLGEGGAEWSPAFSTPGGGAVGVQIIHRF